MKFLFSILIFCLITSEDYIINFNAIDGDQGWVIVNDDVMGGRSTSFAFLKENSLGEYSGRTMTNVNLKGVI